LVAAKEERKRRADRNHQVQAWAKWRKAVKEIKAWVAAKAWA
jgi:hypothetical protein